MDEEKQTAEQKASLLNADSSAVPPVVTIDPKSGGTRIPLSPSNGGLSHVSTGISIDEKEVSGERKSRSTSSGVSRGRSRSPTGGSSATFCDIPQRSRSPTPTRESRAAYPPYSLAPPAITYDEVNTAPNSPTGSPNARFQDLHFFGSSHQLQNKAVMVTPSGSLLAVNQSPLELRESTFTVNYPDMGGIVGLFISCML